MHLYFIDESGTPPKPTAANPKPYFIMAGLVMHEDQWHGVTSEFKTLKAKPEFNVTGEVKWRYFGAANDDADNSVKHLDQAARDTFRSEMCAIITRRKSIKIIGCVTSVSAAYETDYVKDATDLYHYTYKTISERFQYHLQDLSRVVGSKQLGMVIADHRGTKQDDALRKQHDRYVDGASPFVSNYENYIESLLLTPSHHSVGIQFADLIAGAIGRAYNTRGLPNPDSKFADLLGPSFRRSPSGKIEGWGLVKFPTKGWK